MTDLYTGQEYEAEYKIKKKMLIIWYIMLAVYLIISVIILISFTSLPYGTKKTVFIYFDIGLSTLFWGYSLFFFNNKYGRIRKYVKMLGYLDTGLKETYDGQFLRFDNTIEVKEGVEFYKMITKEWNEGKQEYFERKVLIDIEKPKPEIAEGLRIRYITQGNILVRYKILRTANEE